MKIEVEPQRLRDFLKMVLISGKLEQTTIKAIQNDGTSPVIEAYDSSLKVVSVAGRFYKDFFLSYICEAPEEVVITNSLLTGLGQGFSDDKRVTFETTPDEIIIKGITDEYRETKIEKRDTPFKIPLLVDEIYGIQNESQITKDVAKQKLPKARLLIDVSTLQKVPKSDSYLFGIQENKITVTTKETGIFIKRIEPKRIDIISNLESEFDDEYLRSILEANEGEVWFSVLEQGSTLAKVSKNYLLTYFLQAIARKR